MKNLLLFVFLALATALHAQVELNPNAYFESGQAPNSLGGVGLCTGYSSAQGTPDYFKVPQFGAGTGIPDNYFGFQQDVSDGEGYLGFMGYSESLPLESIFCTLSENTIIGHSYRIAFSISLANTSNLTCDNIGFNFCGVEVVTPYIITDTSNWIPFVDTIIAPVVSNLILFGQLRTSTANIFSFPIGAAGDDWAYFYVGACSVEDLDQPLAVEEQTTPRTLKLISCTSLTGQPIEPGHKGFSIEEYVDGKHGRIFKKVFHTN